MLLKLAMSKKPSNNQLRRRAEVLAKEKAEEVFKDQVHGTRCTNAWLQGRVVWFETESINSPSTPMKLIQFLHKIRYRLFGGG